MKFAKQVVVGALAGLGLMSQAFAVSESKVQDMGTLGDGQFVTFANIISKGSTFTDYLNFTLASPADITGVLGKLRISNFTATLTSASGFSESFHTGYYTFDDLASGNYTMTFTGTGRGHLGGNYGTIFSVATVPEADTWLMILIGAGLVAIQLRRKQKTLRHRPLTAA
jgi:type 1 fimbria pilin